MIVRTLWLAVLMVLATPAGAKESGDDDRDRGTGQQVYEKVCVACHGTGALNAPKFGDANAWKKLIAEGQHALVRSAIKGIRQMPARGGNPGLSDKEVERAVVYMANAAGARFKDPK